MGDLCECIVQHLRRQISVFHGIVQANSGHSYIGPNGSHSADPNALGTPDQTAWELDASTITAIVMMFSLALLYYQMQRDLPNQEFAANKVPRGRDDTPPPPPAVD